MKTDHRTPNQMMQEFEKICDTGGRFCGTESEIAARELLIDLGKSATSVDCKLEWIKYRGWKPLEEKLILPDGEVANCFALVRSPSTPEKGVFAEVIDLGRGTPDQIIARRDEVKGRIVMVRHELMFSSETIHRRVKLQAAIEAGAVGFLIVSVQPGLAVVGSSMREGAKGIPAAGISPEIAARLVPYGKEFANVTLKIKAEENEVFTPNLIFEMPGTSGKVVTLSAHLDGHRISESAIDNASGLAVALETARRVTRDNSTTFRHTLRLAFFTIEEWGLAGSRAHLEKMSAHERSEIILNVNLDSVSGSPNLTALTSGFVGIEPFLQQQAELADVALDFYTPLQQNSDHASFAEIGIPAFRIVAGFNEPDARTTFVLTPADTRTKVCSDELDAVARLAYRIITSALDADTDSIDMWRGNSSIATCPDSHA